MRSLNCQQASNNALPENYKHAPSVVDFDMQKMSAIIQLGFAKGSNIALTVASK
jgi:hypothetical protein